MFLKAGFNPRGRVVCVAKARCGNGEPRWTRLFRFRCGELAWIGRRFGWAMRNADYIVSVIRIDVNVFNLESSLIAAKDWYIKKQNRAQETICH